MLLVFTPFITSAVPTKKSFGHGVVANSCVIDECIVLFLDFLHDRIWQTYGQSKHNVQTPRRGICDRRHRVRW